MNAGEKLLIFIYVLQMKSNRDAQERFQHNGETVSRCFNDVFAAVRKLEPLKHSITIGILSDRKRIVRSGPAQLTLEVMFSYFLTLLVTFV